MNTITEISSYFLYTMPPSYRSILQASLFEMVDRATAMINQLQHTSEIDQILVTDMELKWSTFVESYQAYRQECPSGVINSFGK